jgi:RNA polymerase subunit RPABC4/transcription elongation factor Spt4
MALVKCSDCNHKISDSAKTCPNCGHVYKEDIDGLLFVVGCAIIFGLFLSVITAL